jgi:hypothetical protein
MSIAKNIACSIICSPQNKVSATEWETGSKLPGGATRIGLVPPFSEPTGTPATIPGRIGPVSARGKTGSATLASDAQPVVLSRLVAMSVAPPTVTIWRRV